MEKDLKDLKNLKKSLDECNEFLKHLRTQIILHQNNKKEIQEKISKMEKSDV